MCTQTFLLFSVNHRSQNAIKKSFVTIPWYFHAVNWLFFSYHLSIKTWHAIKCLFLLRKKNETGIWTDEQCREWIIGIWQIYTIWLKSSCVWGMRRLLLNQIIHATCVLPLVYFCCHGVTTTAFHARRCCVCAVHESTLHSRSQKCCCSKHVVCATTIRPSFFKYTEKAPAATANTSISPNCLTEKC